MHIYIRKAGKGVGIRNSLKNEIVKLLNPMGADIQGYIARADANWPNLLAE